MSVPWWVRLVQGLVQAFWWEELVPAHWWVDLCHVPLVGRAMSRGVFIGGSWLRTTLDSLSPEGWDCVPTLFIVWPEASQDWILQAVGWGRSSVPKWRPPGELTPKSFPLGPTVSHSRPPRLPETLQCLQVGLAQALMESLLCPRSQCT